MRKVLLANLLIGGIVLRVGTTHHTHGAVVFGAITCTVAAIGLLASLSRKSA